MLHNEAELLKRIELSTSSLPRKCSTPELQQLFSCWLFVACCQIANNKKPPTNNYTQSGRRGSNPRPIAWKAIALPTELLPLFRFTIFDFGFTIFKNHKSYIVNHKFRCGEDRIRTCEDISQQIYSLSQLAALVLPLIVGLA